MLITALIVVSFCVSSTIQQAQWKVSPSEQYFKDKFLKDPTAATAMKQVRPQIPRLDNKVRLITVELGYKEIVINHVDETNGYFSITAWEFMSWTDTRLSWNETEYPGLKVTRISSDYIWVPDISFTTSSSNRMTGAQADGEKALVNSTGFVKYVKKQDLHFYCSMDITKFPYDTQSCSISLVSWIDQAQEFHLIVDKATHLVAEPHSDWKVKDSVLANRTMFSFTRFSIFENVVLTLDIERRPEFFYYMYILPAAAIAFILPIIHLFPPSCSEKTTAAGLLLVGLLILYQSLCQQLRGFEEVKTPHLLGHYGSQIIMIAISIGVSSYTASLANAVQTSRRVPAIIRKAMNTVVAKICCFRPADFKGEFTQVGQTPGNVRYDAQNDMAPIVNHISEDEEASDTQSQISALYLLATELRYGRERRQLDMEWYQLALLIDRVTAIAFSIYTLIAVFSH